MLAPRSVTAPRWRLPPTPLQPAGAGSRSLSRSQQRATLSTRTCTSRSALRAHLHLAPGLHSGRGASRIHAGSVSSLMSFRARVDLLSGPGGSRRTGAGDSPGESVSARAPLALVLAKGEDLDAAGLRPGDVGFGFSPRRDAPRMAGQSRKPHSRNPPPFPDRLADATESGCSTCGGSCRN